MACWKQVAHSRVKSNEACSGTLPCAHFDSVARFCKAKRLCINTWYLMLVCLVDQGYKLGTFQKLGSKSC